MVSARFAYRRKWAAEWRALSALPGRWACFGHSDPRKYWRRFTQRARACVPTPCHRYATSSSCAPIRIARTPGELRPVRASVGEESSSHRSVGMRAQMGMGEPADNLRSVSHALSVMVDPFGFRLAKQHVCVSTVGPSPRHFTASSSSRSASTTRAPHRASSFLPAACSRA